MATENNIEAFFSGNDARLLFTVVDEDTGAALNLTGAQALEWQLAKKSTASTPLISKSLDDGIVITNAVTGEFTVTLDAADTEALKGADYYHEARLTNSEGKKGTIQYGTFTIVNNLIRD